MKIICMYLVVINIVAIALYGMDKAKAVAGAWRIPEKTLIGIALLGGSAGALLGMYCFHHKTRKTLFRYGIPVILLLQLLFTYGIWSEIV